MTHPHPVDAIPRSAWILVCTRGLSSLGSTFTSFGLNVWIYQQTGSFPVFALLTMLAGIPDILVAPFAGVLADRMGKKRVLLAADLAAAAVVVMVLVAVLAGRLGVPLVAVAMIVLAVANEVRWAALGPAVSLLVPKSQLGRVNGVDQTFRGVNVMLGPVLGGLALGAFGLKLLLEIDLLSYAIAVGGILSIRLVEPSRDGAQAPRFANFRDEVTYGFRWVFARDGLRRLLMFLMAVNIGLAVFAVTFTPYLLSFSTQHALGMAQCMEGGGAFLAGLVLARRKLRVNHQSAIVGAALAMGVCMLAWGFTRSPLALFALAGASGAIVALLAACSQTIWQRNVPVEIQGKVFAVRTVVAFGLTPFATLVSIPLATRVFEPLLASQSVFATAWGTAPAGPLGLLASTFGLGIAALAIALAATGGLRIEAEDDAPTPVPGGAGDLPASS